MKLPRELRVVAVLLAVGLVVGVGGGATYAAFSATTSNGGNSLSTAADWTPPTVPSAVIAHSTVDRPITHDDQSQRTASMILQPRPQVANGADWG